MSIPYGINLEKRMIKIVSGYSGTGGSTEAFINLANFLQKTGIETCFYGPQTYHLDKCNGKSINELRFEIGDVYIYHLNYYLPPQKSKVIYSCHEKPDYFNLTPLLHKLEYVHFVSEQQKNSYNPKLKTFVLPNIIPPIKVGDRPKIKIGGVIGTIFPLKNIHTSIEKALEDGCEKVLLYGDLIDVDYYNRYVKPLVDKGRVQYCGYETDKGKIYSSVTDVYHYSHTETWGYIEGECYITKTPFHKPEHLMNFHFMENEDIIKKWCEVLEIPC